MASDNPTRTFKDFIGWAFVGMASIVLALISMIYSSLHADVVNVEMRTQQHAERIKGTEDRVEGVRESLQEINRTLRELNQKIDGLKR